jgi:hypothetical protein
VKLVSETYTPRPFWGRGAQGASEGSIRGRKVVLAQHGHAAQQPFSEKFIPPQESRISQLRSFYPEQALEREHPKNWVRTMYLAQMNASLRVRVSRLKLGSG